MKGSAVVSIFVALCVATGVNAITLDLVEPTGSGLPVALDSYDAYDDVGSGSADSGFVDNTTDSTTVPTDVTTIPTDVSNVTTDVPIDTTANTAVTDVTTDVTTEGSTGTATNPSPDPSSIAMTTVPQNVGNTTPAVVTDSVTTIVDKTTPAVVTDSVTTIVDVVTPTNNDDTDKNPESDNNKAGLPIGILIGAVVGAVVVTAIVTTLIVASLVKRRFAKISDRTANFESLYANRPIGNLGTGTKLIDFDASHDFIDNVDDDEELLGGL